MPIVPRATDGVSKHHCQWELWQSCDRGRRNHASDGRKEAQGYDGISNPTGRLRSTSLRPFVRLLQNEVEKVVFIAENATVVAHALSLEDGQRAGAAGIPANT